MHFESNQASALDFRGVAAIGVALLLSACAETSLNEAPVIDLSTHPGQRPAAAVQSAPAPVARAPAPVPPPSEDAPVPAEVTAIAAPGGSAVESHPLDSLNATPLPPDPNQAATSPPAPVAVPANPAPAPGATPSLAAAAPPAAPAVPVAPPPPAPVPAPAAATSNSWIWPVDGAVTSAFNPAQNKGIDIAAAEDAPVVAAADGKVNYTGSPAEYGNLVVVSHANGLITAYAHLKSITVKQDELVSRGQPVGTAGKTTQAAAFVHFEVRRNGVPLNPVDLLPPR